MSNGCTVLVDLAATVWQRGTQLFACLVVEYTLRTEVLHGQKLFHSMNIATAAVCDLVTDSIQKGAQ